MKKQMTMRMIKEHDRLEDKLVKKAEGVGAGAIRSKLLISRQLWRDNGRWNRYFLAREGRVHGTRYCPTLTETTTLVALWELSGEPIDEVAAGGFLLCARCFPEAPRRGRRRAVACDGSGERSRCRCGDAQCRQMCPHCGKSVLVTPSGVLRRHG